MPTRKARAHSRDSLHYDESGTGRQKCAAREHAEREAAEEAHQREELAKKARFDKITTVEDLGKAEYKAMRLQPVFSMTRTTKNPN